MCATLIYKSNWRITTAIVIFQQRHRARFRARGISSKNTQISIPKAAGSALSTPRSFLSFYLPPSLPLSLPLFLCFSLCLSYASCAGRKRSNSPVSRDHPYTCVHVRIRARVCARPVTRINPVYPHVKCTVKRKWPPRTGEPPLPPSPPSLQRARCFLSALSSAI